MNGSKSKAELLELIDFAEVMENFEKAGARITPTQIALFGDALWNGYLAAKRRKSRPMSDRERNLKKTVVDGVRSSFADARLFLSFLAAQRTPKLAWFSKKDLRRVVTPREVAELVDDLCHLFGTEYGELILEGLRLTYEGRGERLTILRTINYGSVRPNEIRAVLPGMRIPEPEVG